MKFNVNTKEFKKVVRRIAKCAGKVSGDKVNANAFLLLARLQCKPGGIEITCLNGDFIISELFQTNVVEWSDQPIWIEAKDLKKLVNATRGDRDGSTQYLYDEKFRELTAVDDSATLTVCTKAQDEYFESLYTQLAAEASGGGFKVADDLIKYMRLVSCCCSMDEARPVLQGIKVGKFFGATDGFRIGYVEVLQPTGIDVIIPAKVINSLPFLSGKKIDFKITERNEIILKSSTFTVGANLLDGNFPDAEAIIPKNVNFTVLANRKEILQILGYISSLFEIGYYTSTRFEFTPGDNGLNLDVICAIEAVGKINGSLHIEEFTLKNEFKIPFTIAINPRFLAESLMMYKTEKVWLGFNANNTPMTVYSDDPKDGLLFVIMPMHIG